MANKILRKGMFDILRDQRNENENSLGFYLTLVSTTILEKAKCWQGNGETYSCSALWECKLLQPLWESDQRILKNTGSKTTIGSSVYSKNSISAKRKGTCISKSGVSLFRIPKIWKQPRRHNGWMEKENMVNITWCFL